MKASIGHILVSACAVVLFAGGPVHAALQFQANITYDQEVANPPVPPQVPLSSGVGVFELNDSMTALSYDITLTGLDIDGLQTPSNPNDNAARFHIHAAPAGANGGIVFGMKDPNHDVDDLVINPATGRITGVWDGTEGNGTTLQLQLANLLADGLYFNVHTPDVPGGEIRGQILLVPEPSSFAVFTVGLLGLMSARRRPNRP